MTPADKHPRKKTTQWCFTTISPHPVFWTLAAGFDAPWCTLSLALKATQAYKYFLCLEWVWASLMPQITKIILCFGPLLLPAQNLIIPLRPSLPR